MSGCLAAPSLSALRPLSACSPSIPIPIFNLRRPTLLPQQEHGIRLKGGSISTATVRNADKTQRRGLRPTTMNSKVDYTALQAQAQEISRGEEVRVNHRALIDKILSRYASGRWSTLRELIQNADDAGATRVSIKIDTKPSVKVPAPQSDDPSIRLKHVMQNHTVNRWIVENNGERFTGQDWSRLTEIAKGNPDEDKIGAFGVGFYSVFYITDKPFVSSGSEALEFYYEQDALCIKRLKHGFLQGTDTTFILEAKDQTSSALRGKDLLSLCTFLTGSMTFVRLQSIELWIDEWRILNLQKSVADSTDISIPKSIRRTTNNGTMRIASVAEESVQLEAEWMHALAWSTNTSKGGAIDTVMEPAKKSLFSFFKKAPDSSNPGSDRVTGAAKPDDPPTQSLTALSRHKTFHHVHKASIQVTASPDMSAKFLQSRKKLPPKSTTLSCLTQSHHEREASSLDKGALAKHLFDSVTPTPNGFVYIGSPTVQATGLGAHLSIPAIVPTYERVQIDMNKGVIRTWNVELFQAAGIVARISWTTAMASLRQSISRMTSMSNNKALTVEELKEVQPVAMALYETFDWRKTTPDSTVGEEISNAFWGSSGDFELFSSRGIVSHKEARVAPDELTFVDEVPIVPESMLRFGFIQSLRDFKHLQDIDIPDIVQTLESSPRTADQLHQLLAYLVKRARANKISQRDIRSVLNVTVATNEEEPNRPLIALSEIKDFINPDKIPPNMPVPPTTIPFKFTKTLNRHDTDALGFQELQIVDWLRWLLENRDTRGRRIAEHDVESNVAFAASVLKILSKQWVGLSQDAKTGVTALLQDRSIMPTKMGMKVPAEAYFSSVKLFQDLPVIQDLPNVKEVFLASLGVRKTLEISVVFDRLMGRSSQTGDSDGKWSHVDLIKYLVGVWPDVPKQDRERLQKTPVCPSEEALSDQLFRISDLYEPSEALRRLGLRTLRWPGVYVPGSKEGRLLAALGLRSAPPCADLIQIIANAGQSKNTALQQFAFGFFIENYQSKGYDKAVLSDVKVPFLPVEGSDKLCTPSDCFTNEGSQSLGFELLRSDLHRYALQFGVQPDPPIERSIRSLMRRPPSTNRRARETFRYMFSCIRHISKQHAASLGEARIVPVSGGDADRMRFLSPRDCFLEYDSDFAKIFAFVDFGEEAKMFLLHCGSKHRPETIDVARLIVEQPGKFWGFGVPKYMDTLIMLSRAWDSLKQDKRLVEKMKQSPFLLASKELTDSSGNDGEGEEGESAPKVWQLAKPADIVVIDHPPNYQIFKAHVIAAPQQDDALEDMYLALGAPYLGSLITQRQNLGKPAPDQSAAFKLRDLIRERAPLYFHNYHKERIRHDAKWLENQLSVEARGRITVRMWLKGNEIPHEEIKTAALSRGSSGSYSLMVTPDYDILQVSQVLSSLLLHRSKWDDETVLERLLGSSLIGLQRRGVNVRKILRQKEKEQKAAQEQYEQLRIEQERRAQEDREALQQQLMNQRGPDEDNEPESMPGGFPDAPASEEKQEPESFFEGIGKRFGFDFGRKPRAPLADNDMGQNQATIMDTTEIKDDPLPPAMDTTEMKGDPTPAGSDPALGGRPDIDGINADILRAMQGSRPNTSGRVIGERPVHKVEEEHTTCDPKPDMRLVHSADVSGFRFFIDQNLIPPTSQSQSQFAQENLKGLQQFATVLHHCATIFGQAQQVVNIFYDDSGGTIAFNQRSSLYFNYRFFKDEFGHLSMMEQGYQAKPIVNWASTMAHELT
ncbi:MAG: hypothetical protein Q9174_002267 [Haloplaca sp. 1 TL-2023]